MTRLFALSLQLCLILYVLIIYPINIHAQEPLTIQGQIVNMTPGGVVPPNLTVTLQVIDTNGDIETIETTVHNGLFNFQISALNQQSLYVLSTIHQTVHYTEDITNPPQEIDENQLIKLMIYESTDSQEFISSIDTVLLVTNADPVSNEIQIFERVTLINTGNRSYVPDLEQPHKMNFLRFSLPSMSTNLDVRSTLKGGAILTVDKGFAITSPVPPGESELRYSYQAPYSGNEVKFNKSFHWDTKTFRALIPKTIGSLTTDDNLPIESVNIGTLPYHILEKHSVTKESRMQIHFSNLPQLSVWHRSWHEITKKENAPKIIAIILGAPLIFILIFSIRKNRSNTSMTPKSSDEQNAINNIAQLDNMFDAGLIGHTEYVHKRRMLKTILIKTRSKLSESSIKSHSTDSATKSDDQ